MTIWLSNSSKSPHVRLTGRRLQEAVRNAADLGIVIPAFNVPYLPMLEPIARTLAEHRVLGMIQVARLEITKFESKSLSAVADEYHKYADPTLTSLHLDHTPVIDEDGLICNWESLIQEAISLGYDSVMIDGSRLPLRENIAVTRRVVEMAHPKGVLVEAELGAVLGHEAAPLPPYDELFENKKGFTDPQEAKIFVLETGVDWLSVSVGTIHGPISQAMRGQAKVAAKIDIEHLRTIREATNIPLVLHGGSGVQQSYLNEAIRNGIAKINIATDIRQPYEGVLSQGGDIRAAQAAVASVVRHLVCDTYNIQGSADRL